jgi:hypothetical protein
VVTFGFNAIAFSQPVIAGLFYLVYLRVLERESVRLEVFRHIRWSLLSALAAGLTSKKIMGLLAVSPWGIAGSAAAGFLVYAGAVYLAEKPALLEFQENLRKIAGAAETI